MNRKTQASSVLDLATQPALSTHPTPERRMQKFPGLDHTGTGITVELDIQDTLSTEAKQTDAQANDRFVEDTDTQKLLQINSELLTLGSRVDQSRARATLNMFIRGTGQSQSVVDGTTATLIEDILHGTSRFIDILGSIAGQSQSQPLTNIASSTDSSLTEPRVQRKGLAGARGELSKPSRRHCVLNRLQPTATSFFAEIY
jgi:hypothetical protein